VEGMTRLNVNVGIMLLGIASLLMRDFVSDFDRKALKYNKMIKNE
jgi:hypothetical protein